MQEWKNSLINLLNIAGTGPIIGPIQGILFGPIAFLTIPIGNIIGGAMHDYFSGMICLRDGGTQMPEMIRKYSNKGVYSVDVYKRQKAYPSITGITRSKMTAAIALLR